MSEAKSSKGSKAKTASAPKAVSKSESAAPAAAPKTEAKPKDDAASTPAASADAKAPEAGTGATTEAGTEAGKSAREAIGGKEGVHYGYFSSVRTPAYRSGWDSIWGSSNGADTEDGTNGENGAEASRQSTPKRAAKTRKRRAPITVTLALDDLPPPLKDALEELARAELKKSRISYERRNKTGAVDWRITCRVE